MTRQEFINEVNSWSNLIDFCREEGCDICENIYDEYDRDDYISNNIVEMARNCDCWEDLRDELDNIQTGYDYYYCNDGDWEALDNNDFNNYKDDVLEWMDTNDYWGGNDNYDDDDTEDENEDWYEDECQAESNVDINEFEILLLK